MMCVARWAVEVATTEAVSISVIPASLKIKVAGYLSSLIFKKVDGQPGPAYLYKIAPRCSCNIEGTSWGADPGTCP